MLSKLDISTSFIGKVGNDHFGDFLIKSVEKAGICTDYIVRDKKVNTTLAFVHTLDDGDRDFTFYRNPGADMMLTEEDVQEDIIKQSTIFHFGTLSMTSENSFNATKKAIKIARENNIKISFDPNLRIPLWESLDLAKKRFDFGMSNCDILKISDYEILWFTGKDNIDDAINSLRSSYNIPFISLTMGKDGSRFYHKNLMIECPTFNHVKTIDTTGAGDTFGACMIYSLIKNNFICDLDNIKESLIFANAAASLITTKAGALSSMPTKNDIINLIENNITEY